MVFWNLSQGIFVESCFYRHNVLTQDIVMVEIFLGHFPLKIWKAHLSLALIKVSYCLWNTLCIQNAQRSVNHWHRRCSKCCECCMLAKVSSAHEICSRSSGYNLLLDYSLLIPDRVLCWCMQQERRWYLFTWVANRTQRSDVAVEGNLCFFYWPRFSKGHWQHLIPLQSPRNVWGHRVSRDSKPPSQLFSFPLKPSDCSPTFSVFLNDPRNNLL